MKKILIILLLTPTFTFAQNLGVVYKSVKECLPDLTKDEKVLLENCADMLGVCLDSMEGVEEIYDSDKISSCNILAACTSNHFFTNVVTNTSTKKAIYNHIGTTTLDKPRYMVFVMRSENQSKITIQKYF